MYNGTQWFNSTTVLTLFCTYMHWHVGTRWRPPTAVSTEKATLKTTQKPPKQFPPSAPPNPTKSLRNSLVSSPPSSLSRSLLQVGKPIESAPYRPRHRTDMSIGKETKTHTDKPILQPMNPAQEYYFCIR